MLSTSRRERLARNIVSTVRDKQTVHVREAIDLNGRSQLVQIRGNMDNIRYCNEIIETHVLPLVRGVRGQVTFQHDYASPHRAQAAIA